MSTPASQVTAPTGAMTADQLAQYNALYGQLTQPSSTAATPIQDTSGGAVLGAQNFVNTPEYSLLYGQQNAQNQSNALAGGTYNPTTAFQQDPAYQYNMDQALAQVNNGSAAKGLLESGQTQRDLQTTAQGIQNNTYQNWLGQQSNLFANYQNQLSNLTNMGSSTANNQATTANSNSNLLAQLLSGANLQTGSGISNANLSTGQNISTLLANLGNMLAGAQLNTGAAQSNNLFQGATLGTQINANNNASNAQTASSINNKSAYGF